MKVAVVLLPMWSTISPPLSINYIGTSLRQDGHDVSIWDYNVLMRKDYELYKLDNDPSLWDGSFAHEWEHKGLYESMVKKNISSSIGYFKEKLVRELIEKNIEVIGFSIYATCLNITNDFSRYIRQKIPNIKIVYGGPTMSRDVCDDLLIDGIINAVIKNEGEFSIRDLVNNWESEAPIKDIDGVLSAEGKNVLPFKRRELSVLEDLPILGFDDFDMTLYSEEILPIMMSRGCVALCTFCDEPSYWGRFRFRSPEHIFRELKTNSTKYGVNFFQSMDSLLNGHQRNFKKLADLIIASKLDIQFAGNVRVSKHMDREFIMNLKKAGCRYLVFGLECGSQRILDVMKKNIKLDWAVKNFRDCKEAGISVHVNMIVGFPGEQEEDFLMTLEFMKKVIKNIDVVNMGVGMSVGEGQDVYIHPERYDLLLNSIGKVEFDDGGQWSSKDGTNNHAVRQDRLKRLRAFLHDYEVFVNPMISNPEIM